MNHPQLTKRIQDLGGGQVLIVGSGGEVDVTIVGEGVDENHARIACVDGHVFVQDLDTDHGTFVNGVEVRGRIVIQPGDRIRFGDHEVQFGSASPVPTAPTIPAPAAPQAVPITPGGSAQVDASKRLSVTFNNLTMTVTVHEGGKSSQRDILKDISLHIKPGQFIGILGASGSGKSTLIKTIAGINKVSTGGILLGGSPTTHQALSHDSRISYLPQDVVIHEQLTPRAALGYITELKGLGSSSAERKQMVFDALDRVGMAERLDVSIHRLSGGQQKRVALAAELLGDPQVVLLDEATSGLDPATEGEMMRLFRSLADEGRTVICITHFPDRLTLCDRLIYLMQGQVAFYGTPQELTRFFEIDKIEGVYTAQDRHSPDQWRQTYAASAAGRLIANEFNTAVQYAATSVPVEPPSRQSNPLRQMVILLRRYVGLQLSDWKNLLMLFIQAPIIGLMIAATYGVIKVSFTELHAAHTKEVIFLLVVAMLWCAGTASVREIVKEELILRHETRFGLKLIPYLTSKLLFLSLLSFAQAIVLLWVVKGLTELTGQFAVQTMVLALTSIVALSLGLLVSAVAGTSERAMTVLPVLLIAQAIFSGGLANMEGFMRWLSQVVFAAWWAMDGIRSSLGTDLTYATYPAAPGHYQAPILGVGGPFLLDLLALTVHGTVVLTATYLALRLKLGQGLPWRKA